MAKSGSCLSALISLISFGMGIASIVFSVRMYIYSKNDYFKTTTIGYLKEKGFLNFAENFLEKKCQCGEEIVNDFCTEEQKLSGCLDLTSNLLNDKKIFLRYLKDEANCNYYKAQISELSDDQTFSEVFNLNLEYVHKLALGIIIITIFNYGALIFIFLIPCLIMLGQVCLGATMACFILLGLIASEIANLVIFIILCVQFNKGKIGEYVDFLDLNCPFVNRNKFSESFKDLEKLRSAYIPFIVINIIFIVFGCCSSAANNKKEEK